tara:strand:- start:1090 stop:1491 length:402 start_codon:yes stop_codon:yes gene_type:complete
MFIHEHDRAADEPGRPGSASPWVPLFAMLGWVALSTGSGLPDRTIVNPEPLIPLVITAVLVARWFTSFRKIAAWALLGWGLVRLLGAILTVLPLTILLSDPEQTLANYPFHVLYGLAQVPLVRATAHGLRTQG